MELRKKICKPQIIRAFLLEKGDVFAIYNARCIVRRVTKKEIFYSIIYDCKQYSGHNLDLSIGANSKEKVKLLFSECEYYAPERITL